MPQTIQELVDIFRQKAEAVNAVVKEVGSMAEALAYAVELCEAKAPAELLAEEPGTETGPLGPNKMPTRATKVLAASGLSPEHYAALSRACEARGFLCLKEGLRGRLAGIDLGLSRAELGVAASGTCVLSCDDEEVRLAGMISEINVVLLPKSAIHPDLPSIAGRLRELMTASDGTNTTFVSGPSRTADIERVPAVGVHGPLELHVLLLEDEEHA